MRDKNHETLHDMVTCNERDRVALSPQRQTVGDRDRDRLGDRVKISEYRQLNHPNSST